MWGIGVFCRFYPEKCGALVRDCSRNDLWVHFGTLEQTQVFPGSCGVGSLNQYIHFGKLKVHHSSVV